MCLLIKKRIIQSLKSIFIIIGLTSTVVTAHNHESSVLVSKGHVRATIPGTTVSSAYMLITNKSDKSVTLIGASTDVSDRVEIHEHVMADGLMKMRQSQSLDIPAQDAVKLQPSGYHLMIFDVKSPLKQQTEIELVLHFSNKQDVVVQLPVESIKRKKAKKESHHHHH